MAHDPQIIRIGKIIFDRPTGFEIEVETSEGGGKFRLRISDSAAEALSARLATLLKDRHTRPTRG